MKTTKDLFAEVRRVEQLLDTIKLIEDRVIGSGKSLRLKRGRSTGSIESRLGLKDKTQGRQGFPKQTPRQTT